MAESTLSLTYNDLAAEVGTFLGWGQGNTPPYVDPAWSTFQQQRIDSCVRSGLRNFYFPTPDPNGPVYDWSFLKPTTTLTISQQSATMPMPDDFGGFEGEITIVTTAGIFWFGIQLVSEGQVREAYSRGPTFTGRPLMASLQPLKGTSATAGQRWQLYVYPLPDQAYTFQFQYYVLADYLNTAFPYALGGMSHAETVLESCLAVAEQREDDMAGVHTQNFQQRLMASIAADRRNKPQMLGYNRDRSDGPFRFSRNHWNDRITYQGVQY